MSNKLPEEVIRTICPLTFDLPECHAGLESICTIDKYDVPLLPGVYSILVKVMSMPRWLFYSLLTLSAVGVAMFWLRLI